MESVKEFSVIKLGENNRDALTIENSFVWVDKMSAEKTEETINLTSIDAIANVAQHNMDTDAKLNNEEKINEENWTSGDDKELIKEQQYWEQVEHNGKKFHSVKPKYSSRQRMTQKELDMIAHQNSIVRSPSFYQFDRSTTLILKMLRDKNIVGGYHNVVACGKHSVVIHANWSESGRSWYSMGVAVKVYKLTDDLQHNNTIFKRVQNESNHLLMLKKRYQTIGPGLVYKCRNVIATMFIGFDQETAPSITCLPAERSQKMYQFFTKQLYELYNNLYLVHGRLSSKNILYWFEEAKFIGWAHSVPGDHPMALRKLMRDCHFVTQFFEKRGVLVVTKEQLFKDVTGLDSMNIKVPSPISRRDVWQGRLTNPNKERDNSNRNLDRNCRFKCK